MADVDTYRRLNGEQIVATIQQLRRRIEGRFPDAGLRHVAADLAEIASATTARSKDIARVNLPLRIGVFALVAVGVALLVRALFFIDFSETDADNVYSVLQGIDSSMNIIVLIGASLLFLFTVEERLKRRRALDALHELRSIVHVIDMHQLTKDPSADHVGHATPQSPKRVLHGYDLARYLDYCSEMFSLAAKVAALYAQSFPDSVVTEAVSDIERLTTNLSQKVWQKIMIVEQQMRDSGVPAAPHSAARSAS
jgi:hypothetical protein